MDLATVSLYSKALPPWELRSLAFTLALLLLLLLSCSYLLFYALSSCLLRYYPLILSLLSGLLRAAAGSSQQGPAPTPFAINRKFHDLASEISRLRPSRPCYLRLAYTLLSQEGVRRSSRSSELVENPHDREKPHKCLECGKGFSHSSALMEHQNIHAGERPCECEERGKSFSGTSDLSKHHKIHTGERLHECLECQKSFRWNSEIVTHTHQHFHIRERPCECPECGRSFVRCSSSIPHGRIRAG
ncbi:zinc finger protein 3-like [Haemorhous mexicanus]|uniref:zinc finger protein 3-like n=1 Tax=Haemorhous mexicanus TaxID=30427 RepID=UPI0028BF3615|nr:zinc finger protein 3-like [Haemorhous mexicanus]